MNKQSNTVTQILEKVLISVILLEVSPRILDSNVYFKTTIVEIIHPL